MSTIGGVLPAVYIGAGLLGALNVFFRAALYVSFLGIALRSGKRVSQ